MKDGFYVMRKSDVESMLLNVIEGPFTMAGDAWTMRHQYEDKKDLVVILAENVPGGMELKRVNRHGEPMSVSALDHAKTFVKLSSP